MINEDKVILMTRLAMYEQSTGKEDLDKARYFKHDYVKYNCLKTLVTTTVAFWLVVAAYIYYNLASIIEKLVDIDYIGVASKLVVSYGVTCVAFMGLAWILYSYRYSKAKPHLIKYNQNLKKLIAFYDHEEKGRKRRRSK